MKTFDSDVIDLTVTSPPYDNLRVYEGYSFDFESIASELYRITKPGGLVIWVVNDQTTKGSESGSSFKQALYFKECGFNLHDTMIYAKNNPIPLTHKRYEQAFEYMFVLSKGPPKTFNPIMIPTKTAGKPNTRNKTKGKETSYAIRAREETTQTKELKQAHNIFYYNVGTNDKTKHNAPFPEELVEDQIISWSNENDIVFDPFLGSGTTAKIALKLNRHFIGCDISKEYCEISEERIKNI